MLWYPPNRAHPSVHHQRTQGAKLVVSFLPKITYWKRNQIHASTNVWMCRDQFPSCNALTVHHQSKHGIIYCSVCNKAFNNPRSLTKHLYQHQTKPHQCSKCDERFRFNSQLTTHKLTHRKRPNQRCMYPKCSKSFKSKSDLNRHASSHSSAWMKLSRLPYIPNQGQEKL